VPTRLSVKPGVAALIGMFVLGMDHDPILLREMDKTSTILNFEAESFDARAVSFVVEVYPCSKEAYSLLQQKKFESIVDYN
jgi:hypothetical protein